MTGASGLCRTRPRERGAVLVEFALVSLVLALLMAVSVEFGRMMFLAQALQDVARVGARELSVTPLPADITFDAALTYVDPGLGVSPVLSRIYDPAQLVVNLDAFATDADVDAFFAGLPLVNRALRPLMIVDQPAGGPRLLRFPGALLVDPTTPTGYAVGIPRVTARDAAGIETIEWVPVVEEIRPDPADALSGPFSLSGNALPNQRGLVALRINYPYQAGALTAFQPNPAGPFEPTIGQPVTGDDTAVAESNALTAIYGPSAALTPNDPAALGAFAGPFGLGRQLAFGQTVRPFRRLLSAQAIFRREVLE